jgi:hypothetical protein
VSKERILIAHPIVSSTPNDSDISCAREKLVMAHGYLGDGFGMHGELDPNRDDGSLPDQRRSGSPARDDEWRQPGEGMMRGRGDEREQGRNPSRGQRSDDRVQGYRSAPADFSGERNNRESSDDGATRRRGRDFSSDPHDHYRRWRDRHMSELDRDYEEFCREREQQFHRDFDEWRQKRQISDDRSGEIAVAAEEDRTRARSLAGQGNTPTPAGEATLGTNNSENTMTGRARGRR